MNAASHDNPMTHSHFGLVGVGGTVGRRQQHWIQPAPPPQFRSGNLTQALGHPRPATKAEPQPSQA
jgi:hypothetical protein